MIQWPRRTAGLLTGIVLLAANSLTSCVPPAWVCPTDAAASGLAISIGDRANSARPLWPKELDAEVLSLAQAAENGADGRGATLVRTDGAPAIGCVMAYEATAKNGPAKKSQRDDFIALVKGELTKVPAVTPEADPLTGLTLASKAAGPGGTVVLLDSGLQTVAPLDLRRDNLLDRNLDLVVAALVKAGAVPDLRDRKVILAGIGYTAAPQPKLSESGQGRLIELWQKIARAGGAREVLTVITPNTTPAADGRPKVGIVPVPPQDNAVPKCDATIVYSDDGKLGFQKNDVVFRDEPGAKAELAKIANWLRDNPSATARVTGSIAHYGKDEGNAGLSKRRAERVGAVLVTAGAAPRQIVARGEGWGPFPAKNAGPDQLSDKRNRRVVVDLFCS
jgi:OmpA-OmpF porin, OOP family